MYFRQSKLNSIIKHTARKVVSKKKAVRTSVRGDGVDQRRALLKIIYQKYKGTTQPKNMLHFSHFPQGKETCTQKLKHSRGMYAVSSTKIPTGQERRSHYDAIHVSKLKVLGKKTSSYCKCSVLRSRGLDDMTRN